MVQGSIAESSPDVGTRLLGFKSDSATQVYVSDLTSYLTS